MRSFNVIGTETYLSDTYTSYKYSIVTTGLSRAVSKISGDFNRKLQNFLTHVYLRPRCREIVVETTSGRRRRDDDLGTTEDDDGTYDFLLMFHSNYMALYRVVSEIFSVE